MRAVVCALAVAARAFAPAGRSFHVNARRTIPAAAAAEDCGCGVAFRGSSGVEFTLVQCVSASTPEQTLCRKPLSSKALEATAVLFRQAPERLEALGQKNGNARVWHAGEEPKACRNLFSIVTLWKTSRSIGRRRRCAGRGASAGRARRARFDADLGRGRELGAGAAGRRQRGRDSGVVNCFQNTSFGRWGRRETRSIPLSHCCSRATRARARSMFSTSKSSGEQFDLETPFAFSRR